MDGLIHVFFYISLIGGAVDSFLFCVCLFFFFCMVGAWWGVCQAQKNKNKKPSSKTSLLPLSLFTLHSATFCTPWCNPATDAATAAAILALASATGAAAASPSAATSTHTGVVSNSGSDTRRGTWYVPLTASVAASFPSNVHVPRMSSANVAPPGSHRDAVPVTWGWPSVRRVPASLEARTASAGLGGYGGVRKKKNESSRAKPGVWDQARSCAAIAQVLSVARAVGKSQHRGGRGSGFYPAPRAPP